MSVPNLKRIGYLFSLNVGQNFEIGSRDLGHANLGPFYVLYAEGVRSPSLYQLSSGYLFSFKSY